MSWIIFILYTCLLCWLLTRLNFFRQSEIRQRILIFLFLLYVGVGCLAGYLASLTPGTDTWRYHQDALVEYQLMQTNPGEYLRNLFTSGYTHGYDGFLQTQNSFWNDLKTNLMVKGVSLLDIFSGGNYYTNVLLFNFLLFFGFVSLYKFFVAWYPLQKSACLIGVFLLPSVLFFGAALHKEGVMLASMGGIWLGWHHWLQYPRKNWQRLLPVVLLLILVGLLRNYLLLALLPAMGSYALAVKLKWNARWVAVGSFMVVMLLFWTARLVHPALDFPHLIQQKQADFLALETANTTIALTPLQPTGSSFLQVLPEAAAHALFRPFLHDIALSWQIVPFVFELLFYWGLLLYAVIKKINLAPAPLVAATLLMSFILLLIIGYTVPILAAILRYRSLLLPFLITPLLAAFVQSKNKLK